jgi:hypothetical protein
MSTSSSSHILLLQKLMEIDQASMLFCLYVLQMFWCKATCTAVFHCPLLQVYLAEHTHITKNKIKYTTLSHIICRYIFFCVPPSIFIISSILYEHLFFHKLKCYLLIMAYRSSANPQIYLLFQ